MMLSELIRDSAVPEITFRGISDDSRSTQPGDVFCAVTGDNFDGRRFVDDAVSKGAVAVLCDPPGMEAVVPVVEVEGLRERLGELASRAYGEPSREIEVIAVTGTNGKTSFTHLLAQALVRLDMKTGLIGTMGHGLPGELIRPGLTTPPAVDMQQRIRELVDGECCAVVLEASSHGLVQGRLDGSFVDTAVFTNLTHDHLDYHESLPSYQDAKSLLFGFGSLSNAVVNLDDDFSGDLISRLSPQLRLVRFSRKDTAAEVYCRRARCTKEGLGISVSVANEVIEAQLPLYGLFNVENVLAVVATLVAMDVSAAEIELALTSLTPVAGRMDVVSRAGAPTLIVDYAHTPDALEKCLEAARDHFGVGLVHCVFGCGGDRDRDKRPMMGEIAARLADRVVLTSDNPRSENPDLIIEQIRGGMESDQASSIADRRQAIAAAIADAGPEDVVLVVGKGHEDYQELGTGRVPFSDYEVIGQSLDAWSHGRGE
ncbi:MAG: UDP-N-acetylmuramoyl-L-alanyl-D-glutamate--2,6-diaminopimelate ligase [Gammaproteobacteria bacterium]|jgi:UDP-N-acetylmuramoyl-L-alanyl-D-glutamate--2,6-diaminopimelate ligase|nr:UDP-N-acetylmuramoyl-L-alanyl-D-glutamate--2,6-diaminopimelate ligase [Gammaproteobacteria bacterium]MBT4494251.1 UDP-N-acetylmuramoyl-L-alanyl-D-glutamate--2,6-diaminopimelate ligase [Gammaproteobacteria bacterium]MBT7369282.1 UDP-N-acetylmuramoyl-L-alanyl-D-glutamate--2,6-diaminopimelate ligase [Gammaproteobacteria bacterium]